MIPVLSQEITDWVVDFLYEDKPSLVACSLASHSFNYASQWHLFRTISIQGASFTTQRFRQFSDSLSSTPRIAECTRELCLGQASPKLTDGLLVLPASLLSSTLSQLSNLRSLRLVGISWRSEGYGDAYGAPDRECVFLWENRSRDFIKLDVDCLHVGPQASCVQDLFDLFLLVLSSKEVRLRDIITNLGPNKTTEFLQKVRRLQDELPPVLAGKLIIEDQDTLQEAFLSAFQFVSRLRKPPLTMLSIPCLNWDTVKILKELVLDVSPTLLHLEVNILGRLFRNDIPAHTGLSVDLSRCIQLTSLHYTVSWGPFRPTDTLHQFNYILDTLSTCPNQLRNLSFSFDVAEWIRGDAVKSLRDVLNWSRLMKILKGFDSLQSVRFSFTARGSERPDDGSFGNEPENKLFREMLKEFDGKGLVLLEPCKFET